jgi:hypothetical protein
MRYGAAVGLALLLVLAGCQGITGTDGTTASPSDTATPVTIEATNDSSTGGVDGSFSYPAGASPDGVDPSTLAETHHESLLAHQRYVLTRSQTQGTVTVEDRFTVDHARQLASGLQRVERDETARSEEVYATADTVYQWNGRQIGNGSVAGNSQNREWNWQSARWTARRTIAAVLATYQFEAETVVSRNGSRLIRYRTAGPRNWSSSNSAPFPTNGSATIEVDERGVVRTMVLRPRPDTETTVRIAVGELGSVEVVRPEWLDAATGPPSVELPAANFSANTTTVELETANDTLETTAVWIHHEGGEPVNTSELDVTVNRARAYDVRSLSTRNDSFTPVRPFLVGETFDPGESIRIVHTVPPRLYDGRVHIAGESVTADGVGNQTFPNLEDDRSIQDGQQIRVLWNRSRPQTLFRYTVGAQRGNLTTDGR